MFARSTLTILKQFLTFSRLIQTFLVSYFDCQDLDLDLPCLGQDLNATDKFKTIALNQYWYLDLPLDFSSNDTDWAFTDDKCYLQSDEILSTEIRYDIMDYQEN